MTKPTTAALPLSLDIDLNDEESVLLAAMALGTTPHALRAVVGFAQSVVAQAGDREMTRGQLVTAVMSVLTLMVKECGNTVEQGQMCRRLFDGLWASCDLPEDSAFRAEAEATASYQLMPHSTESKRIH